MASEAILKNIDFSQLSIAIFEGISDKLAHTTRLKILEILNNLIKDR